MTDAFNHVNWIAVLAAAVAQFVLGGIWFGALVSRHYPLALGIADREPQKPTPAFFIGPFLCGLVTVATSAVLLRTLGITDYGDALALGALIGIGYLGAMTVNIAINPLFPRPFYYAALNVPYFLIGSLLCCTILTALG